MFPENGGQGDIFYWTSDDGLTREYYFEEGVGWIKNISITSPVVIRAATSGTNQISGAGIMNVVVVPESYRTGEGLETDGNYQRFLEVKKRAEENSNWTIVYAGSTDDIITFLDDLGSSKDNTRLFFDGHGGKDFFKIGGTNWDNRVSGDEQLGYNLDDFNAF